MLENEFRADISNTLYIRKNFFWKIGQNNKKRVLLQEPANCEISEIGQST